INAVKTNVPQTQSASSHEPASRRRHNSAVASARMLKPPNAQNTNCTLTQDGDSRAGYWGFSTMDDARSGYLCISPPAMRTKTNAVTTTIPIIVGVRRQSKGAKKTAVAAQPPVKARATAEEFSFDTW